METKTRIYCRAQMNVKPTGRVEVWRVEDELRRGVWRPIEESRERIAVLDGVRAAALVATLGRALAMATPGDEIEL